MWFLPVQDPAGLELILWRRMRARVSAAYEGGHLAFASLGEAQGKDLTVGVFGELGQALLP